MIIKYTETFVEEFLDQILYIAKDKAQAAFKFRDDVESLINKIPLNPQKHRQSIYHNDINVRDLVHKGYIVTYPINYSSDIIEILSLNKYKEK